MRKLFNALSVLLLLLTSCSKNDDNSSNSVEITVSDFTITIDENPQNGDIIGILQASSNTGNISFSIQSQSPSGAISVSSPDGEVKVQDASLFNFELYPIISGVIRATSSGVSEDLNFSITLNDVSETQVCEGNVILNNQEEVNAFGASGCTIIDGSLFIVSYPDQSAITDLSPLNQLTTINGRLIIEDNFGLTDLSGLDNLTYIESGIDIENNSSLTSLIGLNGLNTLNCSSCIIYNNSSLSTLNGLHNVTEILGNITIGENNSLTSLTHLGNLSNTSQCSLNLGGNDSLYNLQGLEGITELKSLGLISNPNLQNLSGLDNLETVTNSLHIENNNGLSSLLGLQNIQHIGQILLFNGNSGIHDFTGFTNLQSLGGLSIESAYLHNLNGLENITTLHSFQIEFCGELTSLQGLQNLESLSEGGFSLWGNTALESLDSLSSLTTSKNGFIIKNNPLIANLDGLSNLYIMEPTLGIDTSIMDNNNLSDFCGLSSNTNLPATITISGNAFNPSYQDILDGNCSL